MQILAHEYSRTGKSFEILHISAYLLRIMKPIQKPLRVATNTVFICGCYSLKRLICWIAAEVILVKLWNEILPCECRFAERYFCVENTIKILIFHLPTLIKNNDWGNKVLIKMFDREIFNERFPLCEYLGTLYSLLRQFNENFKIQCRANYSDQVIS